MFEPLDLRVNRQHTSAPVHIMLILHKKNVRVDHLQHVAESLDFPSDQSRLPFLQSVRRYGREKRNHFKVMAPVPSSSTAVRSLFAGSPVKTLPGAHDFSEESGSFTLPSGADRSNPSSVLVTCGAEGEVFHTLYTLTAEDLNSLGTYTIHRADRDPGKRSIGYFHCDDFILRYPGGQRTLPVHDRGIDQKMDQGVGTVKGLTIKGVCLRRIIRGDLTESRADAIVNAANERAPARGRSRRRHCEKRGKDHPEEGTG